MIEIDWLKLLTYMALTISSGLAIFHGVAGYYHLKYYVRRCDEPQTWKCQRGRFLRDDLAREAMIAGSLNLALGGVLSGIFVYAVAEHGLPTRLYYSFSEYGLTYAIVSTIGVWIVIDATAYYIHHVLHIEWIYKRVHYYHHKFGATTPYTAGALHPVELISLQGTAFAMIFIVPMHPAAIGTILIYNLIFNIIDHSGVALTSQLPWQGPSMFHDDHHKYFHCNFGQHLTLWDKLHGTLRREGRIYNASIFGGKGAPSGAPDRKCPPFIKY